MSRNWMCAQERKSGGGIGENMEFCPLVPGPHLEELGRGPMSLVLSQLVGQGTNYYTSFHRHLSEAGTHTILDNGAYEAWLNDEPLPTLEDTVARAERVGAHEIQFLEKFWDGRGTLDLVLQWVRQLDKETREKYLWHAIVQGRDEADYLWCFDELAALAEVNVIGVPKVVTPHCFATASGASDLATTRIFAVNLLLDRTSKPIHLLGLEDPRELLVQCKHGKQVRSTDSSYPMIHAIHGITYSPTQHSFPGDLPRFDFHRKLSKDITDRARQNIEVVRAWCRGDSQA